MNFKKCRSIVSVKPIAYLSLLLLSVAGNDVARTDAQAESIADSANGQKNVLFLICDDLNCDLGCYGHDDVESPNIDRLAKRGVRFDRAYCQYPLCGPSRASFMSGFYPDQTLIHANAIRIRERLPNVVSMSQFFSQQGYESTRIGKIYHYNVPADIGTEGHDDPQSWDRTVNPRGRDKDDESLVVTLVEGKYGATLSWLAAEGTDGEQTDGIAATEAIKVLEEHASNETPFFLAVGLYRPHTPYVSPKGYFEKYTLDQISVPRVPEGYLSTIPKPAQLSITRKKDQLNLPEETARQAMQAYYASISFADAQVGRILSALDRLELADDTVVVFTSDHGYHMGEHGHWQKTTLFENAARVPLIIAGPDLAAAGGVVEMPVEMVDFFPTLTEMCGLPTPENLSGASLVPGLEDVDALSRRTALTQYANGYSLRTRRYRYTEWGPEGEAGKELYDHRTDDAEMKNLIGDPAQAKIAERLSRTLHRRIKEAQVGPAGVTQIKPKPKSRKK